MMGWSPRTWLLPWTISAMAILQLVLASGEIVPAGLAIALLAVVPFRRSPLRVWAPLPWTLLLPFLAWWTVAATGKALPQELVMIPGWYLGLLSILQVLAGKRAGSWRAWNALSASMLAGFSPGPGQFLLMFVLCLVVLLHLRMEGSEKGTGGFRIGWLAGILLALLGAGIVLAAHVRIPMGGFDGFRHEGPRKGFSSTMRLGAGFGLDPDPSDDDVVVRAWSNRWPRYLKGAVFDSYRHGSWSRSESWDHPTSSRNEGEFSVFCLESDTLAPALGWAMESAPSEGYLLLPPEAGCAGAVSDSLKWTSSGVWKFPGEGIDRGWMWFPGTVPRRILESERHVPDDLGSLLDSALTDARVENGMTDSVLPRLSRWFSAKFRYSLQVRDPGGADPLRVFLRDRQGFCEHFASAGALLARRAGLPARVVSGYAYPDRSAGAWIYRRSNAHAWVEVFLAGRGWTTWDPTPSDFVIALPSVGWRRWRDDLGTWLGRSWHVLRDGSWRRSVENATDDASKIPVWWGWAIGILATVSFSLVLAFKSRKRLDGNGDSRSTRWAERLSKAEGALRREGYERRFGETVGQFLARLPVEADARARGELEAYQQGRWRRG